MHLHQLCCFAVLFAIPQLQFDHDIALFFPGAWVDGDETAGNVDNLFFVFVLDNETIDFVEKWLHEVGRKIPGDNLLPLLGHCCQLFNKGCTILF